MIWRHMGQFFLLQQGRNENSGIWHLHALDIEVDATLAELVQATACRLGLEVDAGTNLAEEGVLFDFLEEVPRDDLIAFVSIEYARFKHLCDYSDA